MKVLIILFFIFIAISCNKSTVKLNEFYFKEQNIVNAKNEVDSLLKKDFKTIHWKTLLHSNSKLVSTVFLNDSIASEVNFKVIPMLTIKDGSIKNYKNETDFFSYLMPDEKNMMVLMKYEGRVFAEAIFHKTFGKWRLREMRAIPKVIDGFWEQDDNLNECFFLGVLADKKSDESIIIRKYCCRFQQMKCYWLSLNGKEKHEFNDFFQTALGKVIENYIDNLGRS
jgi:hypothetical protein